MPIAASSTASWATTSSSSVVEAQAAQPGPDAHRSEERAQGADRGAGAGRIGFAGRGGADGHADEVQFAVAQSRFGGVEGEHLRLHDGQGEAVGQAPARPDRVAEGMDEAHTGAARLPHPREVRGDEHLGSALRGRCRRGTRAAAIGATVRMTCRAIASPNGFGLRESSDSIEWVIASTPVAAVTEGGSRRSVPGSRMVATGRRERCPM